MHVAGGRNRVVFWSLTVPQHGPKGSLRLVRPWVVGVGIEPVEHSMVPRGIYMVAWGLLGVKNELTWPAPDLSLQRVSSTGDRPFSIYGGGRKVGRNVMCRTPVQNVADGSYMGRHLA